jgi:hypothetical protein
MLKPRQKVLSSLTRFYIFKPINPFRKNASFFAVEQNCDIGYRAHKGSNE